MPGLEPQRLSLLPSRYSAILLTSVPTDLRQTDLLRALNDFAPQVRVSGFAVSQSQRGLQIASGQIAGEEIEVVVHQVPCDLTECTNFPTSETETTIEKALSHNAHVVVRAKGETSTRGQALKKALVVTIATTAIARLCSPLAVYWLDAGNLVNADIFKKMTQHTFREENRFPVLWVRNLELNPERIEGRMHAKRIGTAGLSAFGIKELEYETGATASFLIHAHMYSVIIHLLDTETTFSDGDTLTSGETVYSVRAISEGTFVQGPVLLLKEKRLLN